MEAEPTSYADRTHVISQVNRGKYFLGKLPPTAS